MPVRRCAIPLATTDIPQANDPQRVLRLAAHVRSGNPDLPPEFAHPRDRHFYLGALRALRLLDADDRGTDRLGLLDGDPRAAFAAVLETSPVGVAWLDWGQARRLDELDPSTASAFLAACTGLSPSTAARRGSTLRRWVEWCRRAADEAPPPVAAPAPEPEPPPPPPPPTQVRADPARLIAGLARARAKVTLETVDLCFLAALFLRSDRGALASLEDDELVDVFEQVCDLVEPTAESPRKRATHAIQRLRDDRLLQRVDGSGLVRSGQYTLTGLAAAVVEFFLRDEALTKESLALLTRELHLNLSSVRARARTARGDEWRTEVVGPLSVTVRDLVDGIRRRQRGLDADQEEVQQRIGELLHDRWFEAVEACERLLEATSATLRELNEVLLRDTHQFLTVLQEIQQLAAADGATDAEEAAQRVVEQVDVIAAWGSARQRAWSEYYQYVHRFLQDVVRLDPDRALSQRLRDLVGGYADRPFGLVVAHTPSIRLPRPVEPKDHPAPVARPREDRERAPEEVAVEDRRAWLEERVLAALASGADRLADVTARVLAELPEAEHAASAGRVAALVAELAWVTTDREPPWRPVTRGLEIGDWTLDGLKEAP